MSPTNDYYEKKGLIAAEHRLAMTRLAVSTSGWLEVDQWEIDQPEWTETVKVMRHVHEQADQGCQVKLLCGADLLESFAVPDLWTENDVMQIKCQTDGQTDKQVLVVVCGRSRKLWVVLGWLSSQDLVLILTISLQSLHN